MKKLFGFQRPKISTNVRFQCCGLPATDLDITPREADTATPQPARLHSPKARHHRLRSGTTVLIRPVTETDTEGLRRFFHRLSPHSRYQRFLRPVSRLTARELAWLIATHPERQWGWVAISGTHHHGEIVGFAQAFRDGPTTAEFAVAVLDDWQGAGLGARLVGAVGAAASIADVEWLYGLTFENNRSILTYADHRNAIITPQGDGTVRLEFSAGRVAQDFPGNQPAPRNTAGDKPWHSVHLPMTSRPVSR